MAPHKTPTAPSIDTLEDNLQKVVANLAHEFRTPLSIISGHLDMLLDGMMGPVNEKQQASLAKAKELVVSLNRMMTDVLNVATVIDGKVQLKRQQIETSGFVRNIIHSLELLAKQKSITLDVKIPRKISSFWGDPNQLEQCITNVVGNAIKFSEKNSEILIAVKEDPENIRFEVEDYGIGLTEAEINNLFQRFGRSELNNDNEGVGLGLAITKEIIDQHRGKIWVESQPGKGCRFVMELPKDPRHMVSRN